MNFEKFEGDENNPILVAAWVKWKNDLFTAGVASVTHPDKRHRDHAVAWFNSNPSLRDSSPHVREGAHYWFNKGRIAGGADEQA
jgi:hypothetical protein